MIPSRLRIVLVSPRNPLNIGAAARAMSNFGFFDLHLVNAYDVAFREARSAVNAAAVLQNAREHSSLASALDGCSLVVGTTAAAHRQLQHPLRRLEAGGRLLRAHLASAPAALLFGSEKFGLGNDDMSYCHWLLRIPSRPEHPSMNLGQAVAVSLYELIRQSRAPQPETRRPAPAEDLDRLSALLEQALLASGYAHANSTPAKIRRLIRRLNPGLHDAEVLQGMLRQILWKLSGS